MEKWSIYFPKNKVPRQEQIECITKGITFFENGLFDQQILLINAPTGIGKTLIANTIAQYFFHQYGFGTNYVVNNKSLEKQILDDKLEGLAHTYGRSNFSCKQNHQSCDNGQCLRSSDEHFKCEYKPMKIEVIDKLDTMIQNDPNFMYPNVSESNQNVTNHKELKRLSDIIKTMAKEPVYKLKKLFSKNELNLYFKMFQGNYIPKQIECEYWDSKLKALQSPIALHNYWYFINEVSHIGDFRPRYLLVCDEGHKLEDIILNFISFSISDYQLTELGFKMDLVHQSMHQWIQHIDELKAYLISSRFESYLQTFDYQIRKFPNQEKTLTYKKQKVIQLQTKMIEDIDKFKGFDKTSWVMQYQQEKDTKIILKVEFKPIDVKGYVYNTLLKYGLKIIIMSATLLSKDRMVSVLGIEDFDDDDHIQYIDLKSPFPIQNRLVHYRPISNMSYKVLEQSTDKIIHEIETILLKHEQQKGIIHTKSYQLMNMIASRIRNPRILIHDNVTRQDTINHFIHSEKPLVLVSPSLEEGMDFRDDICRFIIIAKVPYLNLGDPQIKAHASRDSEWYSWKAVQGIIQEAGRGVRHETDWCSTYILDSNFGRLLSQNRKFFPQWFLDAIVIEGQGQKQFNDE